MHTTRVSLPIVLLAWYLSPLCAQDKPAPTLSLTLRDAVKLALSPGGNLDVDVADQSVAAAQARLRESQATSKPNVDFSFNVVDERLNLDAFGFGTIHEPGFTFPRGVARSMCWNPGSISGRVCSTRKACTAKGRTRRDRLRTDGYGGSSRSDCRTSGAALFSGPARCVGCGDGPGFGFNAESTLKEIGNRNAQGQALGLDLSRPESMSLRRNKIC